MIKRDLAINKWLADTQKDYYDWVIDAVATTNENYNIDDIVISAVTKNGDLAVVPEEVKSIKGGMTFKHNGEWLKWYNTSYGRGIRTKMRFGNLPPAGMNPLDVPIFYEPEDNIPGTDEMPEEMLDTNVFILNAEDKFGRFENGKFYKVWKENAILTYIAGDGIITFSRTALRNAFLGYCWYLVYSHTTEFGEKPEQVWERKAVFDLDKGHYIKHNIPKELLER